MTREQLDTMIADCSRRAEDSGRLARLLKAALAVVDATRGALHPEAIRKNCSWCEKTIAFDAALASEPLP